MYSKKTKLTFIITAIIATGCSANKLDATNNVDKETSGYCSNGGSSNDYSCDERLQTQPIKAITVNNPNTEAWMNSKLSDIKSWLKTIKDNPGATPTSTTTDVSESALVVRNPAATNPELVRIETLTQNGNHREAMAAINSFIAKNPNSLEAELTKGLVLTNMGQDKEAEALLRSAITRHPTSPELYNNLAIIYSNRKDYGKAIETLLLAFSTHPSYAQVNENLREVYSSVASLAYNRALDLDSDQKLTPQLVVLRRTSVPGLPANLNPQFALESSETNQVTSLDNEISTDQHQEVTSVVEAQIVTEQKPKTVSQVTTATTSVPLAIPSLEDDQPAVDIAKLKLTSEKSKPDDTPKSIVRVDNTNKATAKAPGSSTLAAIKAVNQWSSNWSSQNVSAYIESYVDNYRPNSSTSHQKWKKNRQTRLTKPSFIKVALSNIKSKRISNDVVEVTFLQKYQANTYQDQTQKRLTMKKVGTKWLISKERNI